MVARFPGGSRSWRGDPLLKAAILEQMARHRDAPVPSLVPLEVGDVAIPFYGWTAAPARLDLAAEMLGLPEDLLWLGWLLFETFPDCDEAVAEEIELKRELLALIPVGVDATAVPLAVVAACLAGGPDSIASWAAACDRPLFDALAVAVANEAAEDLARLDVQAAARAAALRAEMRAQWQASNAVEPRLHREYHLIEAATAACRVLVDPRAARAVISRAVPRTTDDRPMDVDGALARIAALLAAQLAALG